VRSTAELSHGRVTVNLDPPAFSVQITIARPAITPSKTLAIKVRACKRKTLQITVMASNVGLITTRLILNARAA